MDIKINLIDPNPEQPRRHFDGQKLQELADSIKENGVIQPIVVQPAGGGCYIIHDGERRWRASKMAGLDTIPAVVAEAADSKQLLIRATVANLQRDDLNSVETARAYQRMSNQGMSDQEIATAVGKSRSGVANSRRLLKLPDDMLEAIASGQLSERVGLAYLPALDIKPHLMDGAGLNNQVDFHTWEAPTPQALKKRILRDGLTSGQIREIVDRIKEKVTPRPCQACLKDTKKIGRSYVEDEDGSIYCGDCWREMVEERWCPYEPCHALNTVKISKIEAGEDHQCGSCHKATPANTWLTERPQPPTPEPVAILSRCQWEHCNGDPYKPNGFTVNKDSLTCQKCGGQHEANGERLIPGEIQRLDEIRAAAERKREECKALEVQAVAFLRDQVLSDPGRALRAMVLSTAGDEWAMSDIAEADDNQLREELANYLAWNFFDGGADPEALAYSVQSFIGYVAPDLKFESDQRIGEFEARLKRVEIWIEKQGPLATKKQWLNRSLEIGDIQYDLYKCDLDTAKLEDRANDLEVLVRSRINGYAQDVGTQTTQEVAA